MQVRLFEYHCKTRRDRMSDNFGWPPGTNQMNDDRGKVQKSGPVQQLRRLVFILMALVVLLAGGFFYVLATRGQSGPNPGVGVVNATATVAATGQHSATQPA